jgi:hypothetical protein
MRILVFALATTMALSAGTLMNGHAQAAPAGNPHAIRAAADSVNATANVQFFFGGYSYCWYPAGWRGPGWYVCDYGPWVSGYWWGGPAGWHGWRWRGGPVGPRVYHGGPRIYTGPVGRGPEHHRR